MSSAITGVTTSAPAASTQNTTAAGSGNAMVASKETFLKLLVAQLKNQDPLNPMDGMAFVGQLAQFSQLEQLMGIREDLAAAANAQYTVPAAAGETVQP